MPTFIVALSPGDHLGPYEIIEPRGPGGMGEMSRDGRELFYRRQVAASALAEGLLAVVDVSIGAAPRCTKRFHRMERR